MELNIGMSAIPMGSKTISAEELAKVLKDHELWLKDHSQGKRAELFGYRFGDLLSKDKLNLSEINLSEADLSGSSFSKVRLIGAKFSGAKLEGANFMNVDLTDAVLDDIDIHNGSISHSDLTRVHAERGNYINCHMWDNCYENSVFSASRFIAAQLCDGDFRGADLSCCDFRWTNIDYVCFDNANLSNVDMRWTKNSYWASFQEANMEDIELVKKADEIETTTIISKSPKTIQILDPVDYSAVDLEMKDEFADYEIGDEIKLIKIDNYIYLVN